MGYKPFIFFILHILIVLPLASSLVTPNKMSIKFDIYQNEQNRQIISLSSDRPILVDIKDGWAETSGEGGNLRRYNYTAEYHGISISYETPLEFSEAGIKDINLCLTANEIGQYKGALIYAPQTNETGSVVQFASWIYVNVTEPPQPQNPPPNNNNNNNGGGGGGGGSSPPTQTPSTNQTNQTNQTQTPKTQNFQPLSTEIETTDEETQSNSAITGNVITENPNRKRYSTTIIILILIALASLIIYKKKKAIQ